MQATLTFNLDNIDDRIAHLRAVKAMDLALSIWNIQELLRDRLKYEGLSDLQYDEAETIKNKINEILNEHNICIDELL